MPNKLKLKKIVAVALCKQGCNPDADIVLYKSLDKEDNKVKKTFEEILKSLPEEDAEVVKAAMQSAKDKAAADAEDALDHGMDDMMENPDGTLKNPKAKKPLAKAAAKLCKMQEEINGLKEEVKKSVDPHKDEDIWKGINPAIRKMFEDSQAKVAAAEAVAKALEEEKVTKQYVEKASIYKAIPSKPEELGTVLKALSGDKDNYAKLEGILKATNEILEKSEVFKEFGTTHHDGDAVSAWDEIQKMATEMVTKSGKGLTKEQAIVKIARDNPELYSKYLKELEGDEQ